ncbi:DoxX family protein [Sulfurimonas sp. C5]|uniref:DoxX family protein n=1 Tax=Sulfurimonas sp. C5 TaxID=3036947 RepID=UPI002456DF25|nr:DoxX family protein [Sulfurimonas sp. C5]MDH4945224.1 DoxX family protein [Sulfurimonas sp. C5]
MLQNPDLAKLILRLSLGILILFHGIHKIIHGISGIKAMLEPTIIPTFFAYGVFVGELIAPIFIILGLYARVAAGVLAFNMFVAIYMAYGFSLSISKHGGISWELPLVYFIMSILVVLLGSGKYSVNSK